MGRLDHYDPVDKKRIITVATKLVMGQIEQGKIECTDEAIKAAMPQAVDDAIKTINAVNEYLCG